jgi:hypothetical protein
MRDLRNMINDESKRVKAQLLEEKRRKYEEQTNKMYMLNED